MRGLRSSITYTEVSPEDTYNGWKNWATWNVALWINNDEGLYRLSCEVDSYETFVSTLADEGITKTPDGTSYTDPALDRGELGKMFAVSRMVEFKEEPISVQPMTKAANGSDEVKIHLPKNSTIRLSWDEMIELEAAIKTHKKWAGTKERAINSHKKLLAEARSHYGEMEYWARKESTCAQRV